MDKNYPEPNVSQEAFENLKKCIPGSFGILTLIAAKAGYNRATAHRAMNQHPEFKRMVKEEKKSLGDLAVSALVRGLQESNPALTIFALKNLIPDQWSDKKKIEFEDKTPLIQKDYIKELIKTDEGFKQLSELALKAANDNLKDNSD